MSKEELAMYFNEGSDARLRGEPCESGYEGSAQIAWRQGWQDVDKWWGKRAKWPHMAKPPVREVSGV